jgi:asparagine synthase (glutamine-hydrolysing)
MFSFGLWDEPRQTLILARDRVGKKPLYYYFDGKILVFASEIKSILRHPELKLEIDEQAVSDYISLGYIPAPKSIYRRIRKVKPGHYLRISGPDVQEVRYWDLSFREAPSRPEKDWQESLLAEFRTAVDVRLMSEVPLGAFLSGGVDSSAVVAMMHQVLKEPVKTATIGFKEDRFDESRFARQLSAYLGTDHHERVVTPDKIATIEKLAWHYDEPFADSSALPTFFVSQVAREKVTVALSGDGGDENFAGYRRYFFDLQENRLRLVLPLAVRRAVFGRLAFLYPKMDWAPQFLRAKSTFRTYEKPSILNDDFKSRLAGYESVQVFRQHYHAADTSDPLSRIQYVDIKTYLTDDILTKVDRASMANSLEVRCPLLDHHLMELVASMPSILKLRGRTGKYIFKKSIERYLPAEILHREKMGFGVPLADWFRGGIRDYSETILLKREDPYVSQSFLQKMWNEHQSGVRDRSSQLWNILMFRLWQEKFEFHS